MKQRTACIALVAALTAVAGCRDKEAANQTQAPSTQTPAARPDLPPAPAGAPATGRQKSPTSSAPARAGRPHEDASALIQTMK
jgi:hypothetical protein